jgi:hypothetical protein
MYTLHGIDEAAGSANQLMLLAWPEYKNACRSNVLHCR